VINNPLMNNLKTLPDIFGQGFLFIFAKNIPDDI